jgi:hypothetical protein
VHSALASASPQLGPQGVRPDTGFDKKSEYIEAIVLGQRGKGGNNIGVFHISMVIEI